MKIRRAAGLSVAAVLVLGVATAASAQRGPGGGMFGGADQARPNPLGLLMRSDVQTHLRLDLKQKQAIEQLLNGARDKQREQMQQIMRNRPQPNAQQGLSREERRQQMQASMQPFIEQMQAARQKFEGELSEQLKQILRPEQVTRLYQLDYQHRGPLALGDPEVAKAVQLSPQTAQEIAKIVNDYRTQAGEMRGEFFRSMFQNNQQQRPPQAGQGQPGQQGQQGGRRPNLDPQEMQARMAPLQQKFDKLKKETEDKIVALLNPQEKANWQGLQGAPFTFRKDIETGNPMFMNRGGFGRGQGGPGGQGRPGGFGGRRGGQRPF